MWCDGNWTIREEAIITTFNKVLKFIFLTTILSHSLLNATAYSSPYPDSGSIYREFKDGSLRKFDRTKKEAEPTPKPSPATDDGISFLVTGFLVHGNTQLSQDEIHAVLNGFTNKQLTNQQLHFAADALMNEYRRAGLFSAKVTIPPQDISDGVVALQVLEGYLDGEGVILENSGERVNNDVLESIIQDNFESGQLLRTVDVERCILLINDLPGLSSRSVLYPGSEIGSARLHIKTTDEASISGSIDFDNFGSYYTGENRLGVTININSPTRNGDQLTARLVTSGADSNYVYLRYDIPVSGNGLRAGISTDYLDYTLKHEFKQFGSAGDIFEFRGFLSQPFIRSRHTNFYWGADYVYLKLDDHDNTSSLADRTINSAVLKFSGDHDDDMFAAGTTYYSVDLTLGNLDISGNQAYIDFDTANTETAGSFSKLNFSVARLQHLTGDLSTYLSLIGQVASNNLDSSQKFFIGGPFSVPGYPTGEASGDDGALVHLDLRHDFYGLPWQGVLQASLFYTYGTATLYKDEFTGLPANFSNTVSLQSVGIGVDQTWQQGIVLRAMLGWQVGDNDGADPVTGDASDKSDKNYRGWIQGIYYF